MLGSFLCTEGERSVRALLHATVRKPSVPASVIYEALKARGPRVHLIKY